MAGETVKTLATCLRIVPWSRTSHIVDWMTDAGRVATVVKGATRPKSAFLGQYDLNYTCETVFYARANGELHALRECSPVSMRERLRGRFRALAVADYCRATVRELSPSGPDARDWHGMLARTLDALDADDADDGGLLARLLAFDMETLRLSGLSPEMEAVSGSFALRGERKMPVSADVARCIADPVAEKKRQILLDAARAIGVFYTFHLDCASEARRCVLRMIS